MERQGAMLFHEPSGVCAMWYRCDGNPAGGFSGCSGSGAKLRLEIHPAFEMRWASPRASSRASQRTDQGCFEAFHFAGSWGPSHHSRKRLVLIIDSKAFLECMSAGRFHHVCNSRRGARAPRGRAFSCRIRGPWESCLVEAHRRIPRPSDKARSTDAGGRLEAGVLNKSTQAASSGRQSPSFL